MNTTAKSRRLRRSRCPALLRVVVLLITFAPTLSACIVDLNPAVKQLDDTTTRTVAVLDDATNLLGDESAEWRPVLQDALATLPQDADALVRGGIADLLRRAPATVGTEFKCDVDFLGSPRGPARNCYGSRPSC